MNLFNDMCIDASLCATDSIYCMLQKEACTSTPHPLYIRCRTVSLLVLVPMRKKRKKADLLDHAEADSPLVPFG